MDMSNTNNFAAQFTARMFARDLRASLAISDARKAENAAIRTRMQGDAELRAVLLATAQRRGESEINWPEYFRNVRVNDQS